jgi:LacI family transcriptional regulator
MARRVTIEHVAQTAGVSKQTVSRAINGRGEISQETRERILRIVRELGYRPNRLANAFHTQQTRMIGLLVADIANPFFAEVARGIQDAAQAHDYHVVVCNTDEKPEVEIELMEHLASQGIDGMITFTTHAPMTNLLRFADSFKPIILVNRRIRHPSFQIVMSNNFHGAQLAVEHLVAEQRAEIGMLSAETVELEDSARVRGFRETLVKHGYADDTSRIARSLPTVAGGYEAAKKLFSMHPATDGIFTYNDLMALGAIRACRDLGRRVPDDISIIGFDDIYLAAMYSPALSTIRIDKRVMGRVAFERVIEAIEHPDKTFPEIELDVEFIARESTLRV